MFVEDIYLNLKLIEKNEQKISGTNFYKTPSIVVWACNITHYNSGSFERIVYGFWTFRPKK